MEFENSNGKGSTPMRDVIFVVATIVFFVVSVEYVKACERLK